MMKKPNNADTVGQTLGAKTGIIDVLNSTTSVSITQGSQVLEVCEILKDGLIIQIRQNQCAFGHILSFNFLFVSRSKNFNMPATAKIVDYQKSDDEWARVAVKFYQMDTSVWDRFWRHLDREQNKADALFKKLKDF